MNYIRNWEKFFHNKKNVFLFLGNLVFLITTLSIFSSFLVFNENRPYVVKLNDPLFYFFNAVDLNVIAFPVIYVALIAFLTYTSFRPRVFCFALSAYTLMVWIRMFAMYITPLDVSAGAIDLRDPIVFMIGTGQAVQKDLFFSGHTATLFLLYVIVYNIKRISGSDESLRADNFFKYFLLFCLIIVAASVVLQKAHYTIDVFAALFFAYGAYAIVKKIYGVR
ncbi:MAG: phosphatase PAP2 family protein [Bacteroidetes bacterium]|nr:phosphatase PAP2 family protein [Bacteroidota bacterium]